MPWVKEKRIEAVETAGPDMIVVLDSPVATGPSRLYILSG
jgi:hypothetical protein